MFTGIIQGLGQIEAIKLNASGCQLHLNISAIADQTIQIGDSIAVDGVCLTVSRYEQNSADFDVSLETLQKTNIANWKCGDKLNLETALSLSTPLGGHLVTGHVDGIGTLFSRSEAGDATEMQFNLPKLLGRFIAQKGSVCINGVSLTSNRIIEDQAESTLFSVMLVPHTLAVTSLGMLKQGEHVHIEIDVIARYLDRMQQFDANHKNTLND